ncbi:MAG: hypothetical protein ACREN8_10140 [Candidatus Dormibacteraceae bacterium]
MLVAGCWPGSGPFRRAARWDGVFPIRIEATTGLDPAINGPDSQIRPEDIREVKAAVLKYRTDPAPFEVIVAGRTSEDPAAARAHLEELAAAGATWWLESADPSLGTDYETFRRRIRQGQPGNTT